MMSQSNSSDLNSLRSLFLIYKEKSVSKAAKSAGVTQPSMSRTLARLRQQFNDRLFLQQQGQLVATAKTEQLMQQLQPLFAELDLALNQHLAIQPETAQGSFHFTAPDFISKFAMASLPSGILEMTPKVEFSYHYWPQQIEQQLQNGEIDLAFGSLEHCPNHVQQQVIAHDRPAIFSRINHPLADQADSSIHHNWLEYPHIELRNSGIEMPAIERQLNGLGLKRQKAVITPDIAAALMLLEKSDYLLIAPEKLAKFLGNHLQCYPLPLDIPPIEYCLYWGAVKTNDQLHQYIRSAIAETFSRYFPQETTD